MGGVIVCVPDSHGFHMYGSFLNGDHVKIMWLSYEKLNSYSASHGN